VTGVQTCALPISGLVKGNRLAELVGVASVAQRPPPAIRAARSGVVCRKRQISGAVVGAELVAEIASAQSEVDFRNLQQPLFEVANAEPRSEPLAGARHDLGQS